MQVCSQCGTSNRDLATYCVSCAAPLPQHKTCAMCGTNNHPQARFCHQCAAPLDQQSAAPLATGQLSSNTLLGGRFLILAKIGQGGMGAIYKATDTHVKGRLWAVKEMSDAALTNPEDKLRAAQAFSQEALMLSHLDHPNLPKVVDHFAENGKQYLVMDYIEGETLEARLERRGNRPFSEADVLDWTKQLCDVLGYLHGQEPPIIFRDLKPGNIMIDERGQVKLIDFGIARVFKAGKATDTTSFGTAGYAPPEQYGKGQTDARSDLYALGATMHHLLTGQDPALKPFQFEHVRTYNPAVSAEVERVIMRAVEREPTQRWLDAMTMRRALDGAIAQPARFAQAANTALPSPMPVSQTRGRVQNKQDMFWAGGVILFVLLFGLAALATSKGDRSRPASPSPTFAAIQMAQAATATDTAQPAATSTTAPSNTPEPSPTSFASPTPRPTATPTATVRPTRKPTATARPTATRRPTNTPSPLPPSPTRPRPTATPKPLARPTLTGPAGWQSIDSVVTFEWSWDGTLGSEQYFDVHIRRHADHSREYRGVSAPLKERSLTADLKLLVETPAWNRWEDGSIVQGDQLWWSVALVQWNGKPNSAPALLAESMMWPITFSGEPGKTPLSCGCSEELCGNCRCKEACCKRCCKKCQ